MAVRFQGGQAVPLNPLLKENLQRNIQETTGEVNKANGALANAIIYAKRAGAVIGAPNTDISGAVSAFAEAQAQLKRAAQMLKSAERLSR